MAKSIEKPKKPKAVLKPAVKPVPPQPSGIGGTDSIQHTSPRTVTRNTLRRGGHE